MIDFSKQPQSAEEWLERAIEFEHYHLTMQSLACLARVIELEPYNFEARRRQIRARHWIREQGYLEQSFADFFRDLYAQKEHISANHFYFYQQDLTSLYLFYLYGSPDHTDVELLHYYSHSIKNDVKPWTQPLLPKMYPTQDPEKKLRVGYLGREFDDFYSCMQLLRPMLANHSDAIEVFLYDDSPDLSVKSREQLGHKVKSWHCTIEMSNEELLACMQADHLDILVDVAGPTYLVRNGVFWERPAPVMVGGLGFIFSSAKYLDYCFSDETLTAPDLASHYLETVKYLPSVFVWETPEPFVCERASGNGLTLGSANSLNKLNLEVISVWAELLKRLPEATLFLKCSRFNDPYTQLMYIQLFQSFGIEPQRLRLEKGRSRDNHLPNFYSQIDVALDTFPYQGAITTCDALWMGVPVVSMREPGREGRALGATILDRVGRSEWVADSKAAYIQKVIDLVNDAPARVNHRQNLRQELASSIICDPVNFCAQIEQAYFDMYQAAYQQVNAGV